MEKLAEKIEKIEFMLMEMELPGAVRMYLRLCKSYDDFKDEAEVICMRYNLYEKKVVKGLMKSLTEDHAEAMSIATSCKLSLGRFKECHCDDENPACYSEYEKLLEKNREHIRNTLEQYEDERIVCDDPRERTMLKRIIAEFQKIRRRFENLLKEFGKIREYERI